MIVVGLRRNWLAEPDRGGGLQITTGSAGRRGAANLDVGPNHVHMAPNRQWVERLGRAASLMTGTHVSDILQNRQAGMKVARGSRADFHTYAVGERKLHQHGYCEVVQPIGLALF